MNEVWKKPPVSLETYQGWSARRSASRPGIWSIRSTTVAHGFLTMSLLSIMSYEVMPVIEGTTMGVNYGFDKLRFISPVRSGSRVRGRFTLAEAKLRKPRELQSRTNVTVEIEGEEKPALVADWIGLIYFS
jgi:acyl dehydratase